MMMRKFPGIIIKLTHLLSEKILADLMSKLIPDPVQEANSQLWRSGPDEYVNLDQMKTFAEFKENKYFTYPTILSKI